MMAQVFRASEFVLRAVFDDSYLFKIPTYQRPYAWTTEEADELLNDLMEAERKDPDDPYFLGSIILIKQDGIPESDVVDGQQRLTTLTMLLCVLRELSTDDNHKSEINRFVWQEGSEVNETQDEIRLTLRERDRDFFREHIQSGGSIGSLLGADRAGLPDSRMRNDRERGTHA